MLKVRGAESDITVGVFSLHIFFNKNEKNHEFAGFGDPSEHAVTPYPNF